MFKIITNRKYQEIEEILQKETNRANDAVRIAAQEKKVENKPKKILFD